MPSSSKGFKNGTSGALGVACNGIVAARRPHSCFGLDSHGRAAQLRTTGNPDVHLVLRDHGPVQAGLFADALGSFGGGCTEAPDGSGTLGDFDCVDVQFVAHEPTLGS